MNRYPLIAYTNNLPAGVAGDARGPFIRIRKGYEADEGLYQHQLRHAKQWVAAGLLLGTLNAALAWWLAPFGVLSPFQAALALGGVSAIAGHDFLYRYVTEYRATAEADAFRTQMRYPRRNGVPLSVDEAAQRLAGRRYKLGITYDHARALLKS